MKHIIILGDGMADWPVKSLQNKTLLQYAKTPYMDLLAKMGKTGQLVTVAPGFHPGSEVANMSVLGYNLPQVYEGRGPLEAASIGVELQPGQGPSAGPENRLGSQRANPSPNALSAAVSAFWCQRIHERARIESGVV